MSSPSFGFSLGRRRSLSDMTDNMRGRHRRVGSPSSAATTTASTGASTAQQPLAVEEEDFPASFHAGFLGYRDPARSFAQGRSVRQDHGTSLPRQNKEPHLSTTRLCAFSFGKLLEQRLILLTSTCSSSQLHQSRAERTRRYRRTRFVRSLGPKTGPGPVSDSPAIPLSCSVPWFPIARRRTRQPSDEGEITEI